MILVQQRCGHTILIFALLVLAIRTSRVTELDQHVHSVFRREIQMASRGSGSKVSYQFASKSKVMGVKLLTVTVFF